MSTSATATEMAAIQAKISRLEISKEALALQVEAAEKSFRVWKRQYKKTTGRPAVPMSLAYRDAQEVWNVLDRKLQETALRLENEMELRFIRSGGCR